MNWLYHRFYVDPDRRRPRFEIRPLERRRRRPETEPCASLRAAIGELFARGLKWVDTFSYFGPDRRSGVFSHLFLERRRHDEASSPPPLSAALRQLRVRVLEVETPEGRRRLKERLLATSLLADAHGRGALSDVLTDLAAKLDAGDKGLGSADLQSHVLEAESMLDQLAGARP